MPARLLLHPAVLLLAIHIARATPFSACRFGPTYDWGSLSSSRRTQEAYVAAALQWDGRFAASGRGTTAAGLTCDHVNLDATTGLPTSVGRYTAASKESLHIGMLALIVADSPPHLAWHWIAGALAEEAELNSASSGGNATMPTKAEAVAAAVARLARIATAYEEFNARYPGFGGFIPWIGVTDAGFQANVPLKMSVPALDNGQLAWSLVAATEALARRGEHPALAARFRALVSRMRQNAAVLFMNSGGRVASSSRILNTSAAVSLSNRKIAKGRLADPWEGELMLFFMTLLADSTNATGSRVAVDPDRIFTPVVNSITAPSGAYRLVEYRGPDPTTGPADAAGGGGTVAPPLDPRLPQGAITVQRGWYFSTHEIWKLLVLPYLDDPGMRRLVANGERARTWDARLGALGGMEGACYTASDPSSVYSNFGIPSVATSRNSLNASEQMITPYGAFPLMLLDLGAGLDWHRATVSRPLMQSRLGSVEASRSSDCAVALKTSWDTKVTADLAMLGGLSPLLRRVLEREGLLEKFKARVAQMYERMVPRGADALLGEETPYAEPPTANATDQLTDNPDGGGDRREFAYMYAITFPERAAKKRGGGETLPS